MKSTFCLVSLTLLPIILIGQSKTYIISNTLSHEVFFSGIVNETHILVNGLDCDQLRVYSNEAKITYQQDCTWEIIPSNSNQNIFIEINLLVFDLVIETIEVISVPPPKGKLILSHWKDPHPSRPSINFDLDQKGYNNQEWCSLNVDKLRNVLDYRLKSANLEIKFRRKVHIQRTVESLKELNQILHQNHSLLKKGTTISLNDVVYEGTDGIEQKIRKADFKL